MTKLYDPLVLGKGLTIQRQPSLPNHAVRVIDLEAFVRPKKYVITNVLNLVIEKEADDFILQVYDDNRQLITPDSVTESDDSIHIDFLYAQSGYIRVLFIGGSSGD